EEDPSGSYRAFQVEEDDDEPYISSEPYGSDVASGPILLTDEDSDEEDDLVLLTGSSEADSNDESALGDLALARASMAFGSDDDDDTYGRSTFPEEEPSGTLELDEEDALLLADDEIHAFEDVETEDVNSLIEGLLEDDDESYSEIEEETAPPLGPPPIGVSPSSPDQPPFPIPIDEDDEDFAAQAPPPEADPFAQVAAEVSLAPENAEAPKEKPKSGLFSRLFGKKK
ncbi:MAG: hypothetical protein KC561_11600, partial [Myxococcales bacterium]|nr:hypothetical protein [Myxococcales bacterium]